MLKNPIAIFILKTVAVFIVWYLIYEVWLLPAGHLDDWLSKNIIGVSSGILSVFGFEVFSVGRVIGLGSMPGLEVANGCNGISAIGLFLGFIIAYPGPWKPKISFITLGVLCIYLVNILRITVLAITQLKAPGFFVFMHDYSTSTIFYVFIFILWMLWVNYSDSGMRPAKAEGAAA